MDFVPAPLRGQFVVHLRFAFLGNREDGDALLAPMRAVSTPLMDTAGPMSYLDVDQIHMDPADPLPFTDGGALLKDFGEEAVADLLELAGDGSDCPLLLVEIRPLGGALSRRGAPAPDAVSGRDAAFLLFLVGFKMPPSCRGRSGLHPRRSWPRWLPTRPGTRWSISMASRATRRTGPGPGRPRSTSGCGPRSPRYDPGNLLRFGHAITGVPPRVDVRAGPGRCTTAAPPFAKGAGPPSNSRRPF